MSKRSLVPAAGDGGTRHERHRWGLRHSSQSPRASHGRAPRRRFITRLLAWVPLAVVILAALGVAGGMWTTYDSGPFLGVTAPFAAPYSTVLVADAGGWSVAPHSADGQVRPAVNPAAVTVEIASLDLPSGTALLQVGLSLSDSIVARLRMVTAPGQAPVPLSQVPRAAWASLPVGIQLVSCDLPLLSLATHPCRQPEATVPLGDLVGGDGSVASSGATAVPVSVPIDGSATRFPSDTYEVRTSPVITLPGGVSLPGLSSYWDGVPVAVTVSDGSSLAQYEVTAFADGTQDPRVIGVAISRVPWKVITVYAVALLPLLLAVVLAHVWVRRRNGTTFDLGFAAGLIAAMLAVLPLRAVLVPGDVGAVSPTLVDDILILGVLLIAGFLFWQYMRFVKAPIPPKPKDAASPTGEVPPIDHPAPDNGQPPITTST